MEKGKVNPDTSTYVRQYVNQLNEAEQTVGIIETTRWLASDPKNDDWDILQSPVHISHQTGCMK